MNKLQEQNHSFKSRVLAVVCAIPEGETMSYKEVASDAGSARAARAVGSIMKQNTDTAVPCHRVIRSDNSVGKYNGLRGDKRDLLTKESRDQ